MFVIVHRQIDYVLTETCILLLLLKQV